VAFEGYTIDQQDMSEQWETISASNADILLLPNFHNEVPLQAQQARDHGITIPLMGGDTWSSIEKDYYTLIEGSFYTAHWSKDAPNPQSQKFLNDYQQVYNMLPADDGALTYDAFGLLFQAMKDRNDITPDAIRQGIGALDNYKGVTGTITYKGTGDPVRSVVVMQMRKDKPVFYRQVDP